MTVPLQNITSLSIDALVFDNNKYILQEVSGLESPLIRLPRYNLPGSSGAFISNALYGERSIKIKGVVNSEDGTRATYINNRLALVNALAIKRSISDVLEYQTMTIGLQNGLTVSTQVIMDTPLSMGFSPENTDYEEFQMTFVAPDPRLYSTTQSIYNVSLSSGNGGTAIPTPIPISLLPSSGGFVNVYNQGAYFVNPIITLSAPLTNPYLYNNALSKFFKLNYTTAVGDSNIIINMANQTVYKGTTDISNYIVPGSEFWGLTVGSNTIGFSANAGSGQAQIAFYPAYIGV